MKVYYSGFFAQRKYWVLHQMRNVLCAFPEMTKNKLQYIPEISKTHWIFLDSWWFSIRNNWLKLSVEDYKEFILQRGKYFEVIANMDTTTKEETLKNQKILETTWYNILPVFHWSDLKNWDKDLLETYCKNYDYIALWWVAGVWLHKKQKEYYLWTCFNVAMKYKTKIHWFGITSMNELVKYPFYSVDSTTWLSLAKYNSISLFVNWKQRNYNIHESRRLFWVDFAKIPYEEKLKRYLWSFVKLENYIIELHKVKWMDYWE